MAVEALLHIASNQEIIEQHSEFDSKSHWTSIKDSGWISYCVVFILVASYFFYCVNFLYNAFSISYKSFEDFS
jgi:hypothetical protein